VTDGASLWVVNDATTDKVFKYTAAGSLLGSWTIGSANSSPTGITIDPANVSDIWIVDNGSDRVYQYTAAASRTTGSQSPATSFALAAGNTNPQGIADPPSALAYGRGSAFAARNRDAAIVEAMQPDLGWLALMERTAVRKNVEKMLAREHVLTTLATRSDYRSAWREPQHVAAASKPDRLALRSSADDDQTAVDIVCSRLSQACLKFAGDV
jgi:hypothetical protein